MTFCHKPAMRQKLVMSPMWIAKRLKDSPVFKFLYQAGMDMYDDRAKIYRYLDGGLYEKMKNRNTELKKTGIAAIVL